MPKRNTVAYVKDEDYIVYGRVWRRVDAERVEFIDSFKHIRVVRDEDLITAPEYKGYWSPWTANPFKTLEGDRQKFYRMPSLRRLKQRAAHYNPQVWRKPKRPLNADL